MKKIIIFIALILVFVSCTSNTASPSFKDGVYTGKGDPWEFGSEDATVTVSGQKITKVVLRKLDTEGKEVDYNLWDGKEVNGRIYPNLKAARQTLSQKMIENQSWDIDAIAGCTISSNNWELAAKRAVERAK